MNRDKIRNIAIIAHVDHGKTTLVDEMFKQSGLFRDNQVVSERLMDSMDQEKERGITITAKNGAFIYDDHLINIIDTPGHADFGGQVESVLKMADGALLLVDAAEGPMPQTFFVLRKAIAQFIPVIVVVNKIDKPSSRCDWVVDQVFDLMIRLNAPDHILDFPVVYTSAKEGYAVMDHNEKGENIKPLFDSILKNIPDPKGDVNGPLQLLVSLLSYNPFLGRLAVGKITSGKVGINQDIAVTRDGIDLKKSRITKIYNFKINEMQEIPEASVGEIVAVSGIEDITMGETITDPDNPKVLPYLEVDPPTISMNFMPNDSPFSGKDGKFVTSNHIKDRLAKEVLSDAALKVETLTTEVGFKVSGRGELHLAVLIEKMRREGFELQVTRPKVIFKEKEGKRQEPYEELSIEIPDMYMGKVMEVISDRKGHMLDMRKEEDMVYLEYKIPTRGLLGFNSEFMTHTKGMGVMNYMFMEYDDYAGEIKQRINGVLISSDTGDTNTFALSNLQDRGKLFLDAGEKIYMGQIIGEHSRDNDLTVNPIRGKKLTNMRASGSDDNIFLKPCEIMSLENCLDFIADDELVEITPIIIRMRKKILDETGRKQAARR